MRELLISFIIFALLLFLMPFLVGVIGVVLLFALALILLARFGLLPGMTYRRYTTTTTSRKPPHHTKTKTVFMVDEDPPRGNGDGWSQFEQEGEMITLPETALKKDDEE